MSTRSGTVNYAATNCGPDEENSQVNVCITAQAIAFITVFPELDPGGGGDGDGSGDDDESDDDNNSEDGGEGPGDAEGSDRDAALPNTGAAGSLNAIGAVGVAFLLTGIGVMYLTRPRGRRIRI
jgi:hypothetical protein